MIIIIKHTQMVIINMKEQVMYQRTSTVEILIHPLKFFQTVIVHWIVVGIVEICQYMKKTLKMNHQKDNYIS